jgi:hypothetical protein
MMPGANVGHPSMGWRCNRFQRVTTHLDAIFAKTG